MMPEAKRKKTEKKKPYQIWNSMIIKNMPKSYKVDKNAGSINSITYNM